MAIVDIKEWNDQMRYKPNPEIEKELSSLRGLVALGRVHPDIYIDEFHKAGERRAQERMRASTQI
jgi:hypothetical protein